MRTRLCHVVLRANVGAHGPEQRGSPSDEEDEMSSKARAMQMKLIVVLASAPLVFLVGCGGSTSQPSAPSQHFAVTVTPSNATVKTGDVQQFTATVSPGNANEPVTWSISGTGCAGASCGTIDETGKYIAPASAPNPPSITAKATLIADSTRKGSAKVEIITMEDNAVPTVSNLSPIATPRGVPNLTLAVHGSNFVSGSVVRWNGSDRPTVFVNSTLVNAQIPESDLATSGVASITVFNPGPAGGSSMDLGFTIGGVSPVSVAVAADPSGHFGKFVYVANDLSDNVSMYTIDTTTGLLTFVGEIDAELYPSSVAVDRSGKFVYVANYGDHLAGISGSISMYAIKSDGSLRSLGTIAEGVGTTSVAVHPSGKFAYVAMARFNNAISIYSIDATSGALTATQTIAGATEGTTSIAVHPSGKFAYTTNGALLIGVPGSSNTVSTYIIDPSTGALTFKGTIAAGTLPSSVAVDPAGKFAYVANGDSDNVSMYTIDTTTGLLTSLGKIDAGRSPSSVAVDPSGKFAYVANAKSNNVSMYTIDATTGALTFNGIRDTGRSPVSITVDPSGKFAYVANADSNSISIYTIDASGGALTFIGTVGT
jgi:YVTN family beta-propeller protein